LADELIILGIDPGTTIMGFGIIHCKKNTIALIDMDIVPLSKLSDHPLKLKKIFETTLSLIDKHKPDELSIEAPFFGKNVQSMLKLGRAQGVAIAAALYRSIPIFEYSPKKIKQSITGNGNATKEQVAKMLDTILKIELKPKTLDATDGLAAAVCHFYQKKTLVSQSGYTGWKSFITSNPDRIKG